MRRVAKLESGHTPSRRHQEYWVTEECVVPWVSLADVWQLRSGRKSYINETHENVSELGLANSSARKLPTGTVVLSRTASVGFSGILGKEMATTQDFANWVCGEHVSPEFLLWVFRAMKPDFERMTQGSTHKTIYMPDIREIRVPLPPLEEQRAIVDAIQVAKAKIDTSIDYTSTQINLLKEYRKRLVAASVTVGDFAGSRQ